MTYVLVYDRDERHILVLEEFTEERQRQADEFRRVLEEQYRSFANVEIVTLISDDRETLRRTHGRYFLTDAEIVAALDHRIA